MRRFSCPSCGAEIVLRSAITVNATCAYCRTLVVVHDGTAESIGQYAILPDDISPLQIGTAGRDNGKGFTLIGRAKVSWEDGNWNEWLMLYDSGAQAWLAEAQGSLAITYAVESPAGFQADKLQLAQTITLDGANFSINDIKTATYVGFEGEFPKSVYPAGTTITSIDAVSKSGRFLSIARHENDPPELFLGDHVAFDALAFRNLRDLPGWTKPRAGSGT